MSKYIDADALMQDINNSIDGMTTAGFTVDAEFLWGKLHDALDSAPTIDIVRCGECKYAEVSVSPITGLWCTRFGINDMAMKADDFCSYGEREGE